MRRLALPLLLAGGCSSGVPALPEVYVQNMDAEVRQVWHVFRGEGQATVRIVKGDGANGRIVLDDRSEVWGVTVPGLSEVSSVTAYSTTVHELWHQYLLQQGGDGDPDHAGEEWRTIVSDAEAWACSTFGHDDMCPRHPGQF